MLSKHELGRAAPKSDASVQVRAALKQHSSTRSQQVRPLTLLPLGMLHASVSACGIQMRKDSATFGKMFEKGDIVADSEAPLYTQPPAMADISGAGGGGAGPTAAARAAPCTVHRGGGELLSHCAAVSTNTSCGGLQHAAAKSLGLSVESPAFIKNKDEIMEKVQHPMHMHHLTARECRNKLSQSALTARRQVHELKRREEQELAKQIGIDLKDPRVQVGAEADQ